jgi:hypothetical protein
MNDVAVLLGAEPEAAEVELKEMLEFEISLANILTPSEERRNATTLYNPTTLGELPALEGLPPSWTEYVRTLFEGKLKLAKVSLSVPWFLVKRDAMLPPSITQQHLVNC